MNFDQLIRFAVEQGASDIHLQTGAVTALANQRADPDRGVAAGREPKTCASSSSRSRTD